MYVTTVHEASLRFLMITNSLFWRIAFFCYLAHPCRYGDTLYRSNEHVDVECQGEGRSSAGLHFVRSLCSSRHGWQPEMHICKRTLRICSLPVVCFWKFYKHQGKTQARVRLSSKIQSWSDSLSGALSLQFCSLVLRNRKNTFLSPCVVYTLISAESNCIPAPYVEKSSLVPLDSVDGWQLANLTCHIGYRSVIRMLFVIWCYVVCAEHSGMWL